MKRKTLFLVGRKNQNDLYMYTTITEAKYINKKEKLINIKN